MILYEMLTGKLPVGHFKLPSMIRPDFPLGLDSIVKRCLAESPGDRYPDAGQIRDELQRLTVRHTAPRSFSALGRLNKRQPWLVLIGAARPPPATWRHVRRQRHGGHERHRGHERHLGPP